MKVLYLDQISGNPERLQQKNNQTVMGAKVFEWNLLCALLEHGTYDAYFAPGVTEQGKNELVEDGLTPDSVKRLAPVPLGGPLPVTAADQVVLLTAGRQLDLLATLRERLQRYDAPVCGFIHSINSARIALALLQQCFVGLTMADLLFCSSRAGMKTIDIYIDEISRLSPDVQYPARRTLVPLGVNIPTPEHEAGNILRQRLKIGAEDCIALYFGRLSQTSKCDLGPLIVALAKLRARGITLHLLIAGDDTQTKEAGRLEVLASELCCHKGITICSNPSAEDKHLFYSGADVFVSPSDNLQETFGLTVVEAMAYGLPAVVSDWDGYRDLVEEGKSGFLVPSVFSQNVETLRLCDSAISMLQEDLLAQSTVIDVSRLSERLEKLALDRVLRIQMGKSAKQYADSNCSWRVVVRRYEELWEESLQIARSARRNGGTSSKLLSLSLEKCFGHYATLKRNEESKCFITAEGREWLSRPGRLYFLCQLSAVPSPRKFSDVLRRISDRPGLSVTKVVQSLVRDSDSASMAETHWTLARLFKYGLVANEADNSASQITQCKCEDK